MHTSPDQTQFVNSTLNPVVVKISEDRIVKYYPYTCKGYLYTSKVY